MSRARVRSAVPKVAAEVEMAVLDPLGGFRSLVFQASLVKFRLSARRTSIGRKKEKIAPHSLRYVQLIIENSHESVQEIIRRHLP
jgi:hypothetical protein